jgi:predicted TIM-barrel fold metal-dependent hydrolase
MTSVDDLLQVVSDTRIDACADDIIAATHAATTPRPATGASVHLTTASDWDQGPYCGPAQCCHHHFKGRRAADRRVIRTGGTMATVHMDKSKVASIMGDLKIIDADSHFAEPADLWTSRAPAKYRGRVPQLCDVDGQKSWVLDGEFWTGLGGHTIAKGQTKTLGTLCLPYDDIDDSAWGVKGRLELMDKQSVYAAVLYPNSIGFASNALFGIEDIDFRNIVSSIYNDSLVDVQNESGRRLLPQAVLPTWDMARTVAEMTRLIDAGITGFTVSDKPQLCGLPDLDDAYFAPMWSLANEAGSVINFHIGSGLPASMGKQSPVSGANSDIYWQSFGPQRRLAVLATQFYMSNVRVITNLIMSDMFDRYPNVKVVSAESGIGWVPFVLEACEYHLVELVTHPDEVKLQSRRPTEYFRSNVYVMSWFERSGMKVIDDIGVDNVMLMTDIPHPTCLYPNTREYFAEVTKNLDPVTRRKIVQDNAANVYGVKVPS